MFLPELVYLSKQDICCLFISGSGSGSGVSISCHTTVRSPQNKNELNGKSNSSGIEKEKKTRRKNADKGKKGKRNEVILNRKRRSKDLRGGGRKSSAVQWGS